MDLGVGEAYERLGAFGRRGTAQRGGGRVEARDRGSGPPRCAALLLGQADQAVHAVDPGVDPRQVASFALDPQATHLERVPADGDVARDLLQRRAVGIRKVDTIPRSELDLELVRAHVIPEGEHVSEALERGVEPNGEALDASGLDPLSDALPAGVAKSQDAQRLQPGG